MMQPGYWNRAHLITPVLLGRKLPLGFRVVVLTTGKRRVVRASRTWPVDITGTSDK